jgi:hypothetical protein
VSRKLQLMNHPEVELLRSFKAQGQLNRFLACFLVLFGFWHVVHAGRVGSCASSNIFSGEDAHGRGVDAPCFAQRWREHSGGARRVSTPFFLCFLRGEHVLGATPTRTHADCPSRTTRERPQHATCRVAVVAVHPQARPHVLTGTHNTDICAPLLTPLPHTPRAVLEPETRIQGTQRYSPVVAPHGRPRTHLGDQCFFFWKTTCISCAAAVCLLSVGKARATRSTPVRIFCAKKIRASTRTRSTRACGEHRYPAEETAIPSAFQGGV